METTKKEQILEKVIEDYCTRFNHNTQREMEGIIMDVLKNPVFSPFIGQSEDVELIEDVKLLHFIDWFGSWQTSKYLPNYGINDILEAYRKDYPVNSNYNSDAWISVENELPVCEYEGHIYTNCICAIEDDRVIDDAIYVHDRNKFYHNQDTTFSYPIPATHWRKPLTPPTKKK